jgi:2-oxoglutarate dehydrogenase complex dehydrogenase (E1) component-like enzyme
VNLLQNPSHLEAITPVALGKARAKQEAVGDKNGDKTVAVLFHGDASFYGQGTIAESLILSKLPEFKTGGAVHIIVNNQLGFTTGPTQARSSRYSADVGKMIDVPVIHVNADHPEVNEILEIWN